MGIREFQFTFDLYGFSCESSSIKRDYRCITRSVMVSFASTIRDVAVPLSTVLDIGG